MVRLVVTLILSMFLVSTPARSSGSDQCAAIGPSVTSTWKPTAPIEVIVPFGAGSKTDIIARTLLQIAGPMSGQPIVVINVSGAGGAVAYSQIKTKPPAHIAFVTRTATAATPDWLKLPIVCRVNEDVVVVMSPRTSAVQLAYYKSLLRDAVSSAEWKAALARM